MEIDLNTTNIERKEKGVTTVEYAVMLVLVALVVLTVAPGIGAAVNSVFQSVISAF